MKRAMETTVYVQADDYFGEFSGSCRIGKRVKVTTRSTQIVVQ
jgi:hypothetical protein